MKTTKNYTFNSNNTYIQGSVFTYEHPSDTAKYEDSDEVLINYIQSKYS